MSGSQRGRRLYRAFLDSPEDPILFCDIEDILRGAQAVGDEAVEAIASIADCHSDIQGRIHASLVILFIDVEAGWPRVQGLVEAGEDPVGEFSSLILCLPRMKREILSWPDVKSDPVRWLEQAPNSIAAEADVLVGEFELDLTTIASGVRCLT